MTLSKTPQCDSVKNIVTPEIWTLADVNDRLYSKILLKKQDSMTGTILNLPELKSPIPFERGPTAPKYPEAEDRLS